MANSAVFNNKTFRAGDTVKVHYKLIEKEKVSGKTKREVKEETRERIQIFEGIVICISGEAENRMITVRKIGSAAMGIERIFPLDSPWIKDITVSKKSASRRAKLFYLRDRLGKKAEKLKERTDKPAKDESKK
jgi:large subunit ribosomal protein L19